MKLSLSDILDIVEKDCSSQCDKYFNDARSLDDYSAFRLSMELSDYYRAQLDVVHRIRSLCDTHGLFDSPEVS